MLNSDRSRQLGRKLLPSRGALRLFLVLSILTCSVQSLGESQAQLDSFFAKFRSNFIQVLDPRSEWLKEKNEDFPLFAAPLSWSWFGFNPSINEPLSQNCEILRDPNLVQADHFFSALTDRIKQCAPSAQRLWPDPISHVLGTVFLKLNLERHPWVRWVEVRLPGGVRVKGLLGLRGDMKKRPFTIFRVGIFASASNFVGEKYLFTQLFEQGIGNFLLLENTSSADFIAHNQRLVMGGVEEGLQNLYIARRIQSADEPLSQLVAGVHLVGMSMGGAGVMYANILNQLNPPSVLQSSLLYCPLLDLKSTIDSRAEDKLYLRGADFWAKSRLRVVDQIWPELLEGSFVQNILERINRDFRKPLTEFPGLRLPNSAQVPRSDPDYFWKISSFMNDYVDVQLPTLIFATRQDPAVPYGLNSGRIASGDIRLRNSNTKLITLDHGYHCTLTMAYNWKAQTQWQQAFLWSTNRVSRWGFARREFPLDEFPSTLRDGPIPASFAIEGRDLIVNVRLVPVRAGIVEKFAAAKAVRYALPLSQLDAFVLPDTLDEVALEVMRRWIEQNVYTSVEDKKFVVRWPVVNTN